jgi:Ribonuclease D
MENIKVNYKYSDSTLSIKRMLSKLPNLIACDFEISSKYDKTKKELLNIRYGYKPNRELLQKIISDGLSHPSLTVITHLSIAWSDRDSYVIICSNDNIRNLILNFLISTDKTQIWHNCIFDFKHIFYHCNYLPKNYIDTQLLMKSLKNDANSARDRVGLKELMLPYYGSWGISKDNFTLEEQWNKEMIRYAACDSCATYKLYEQIQKELTKWKI